MSDVLTLEIVYKNQRGYVFKVYYAFVSSGDLVFKVFDPESKRISDLPCTKISLSSLDSFAVRPFYN